MVHIYNFARSFHPIGSQATFRWSRPVVDPLRTSAIHHISSMMKTTTTVVRHHHNTEWVIVTIEQKEEQSTSWRIRHPRQVGRPSCRIYRSVRSIRCCCPHTVDRIVSLIYCSFYVKITWCCTGDVLCFSLEEDSNDLRSLYLYFPQVGMTLRVSSFLLLFWVFDAERLKK